MKAIWNDTILAESDATEFLEGTHYFPADAVRREYLKPSSTHTTCPWKGEADYFHVDVSGNRLEDGAFTYPNPTPAGERIRGHFAFWKGVEVHA